MGGPDSGTSIFSQARALLGYRNVRVLAFTSAMSGTYLSILNTILQPFVVTELGFTVAVLGTLVSIGNRPLGLASSLVQPFAGALSDSFGRRRLMILGSIVAISSMASFLVAAVTRSILPLSLGFVFLGLSLLGNPATQAVIAETVEMDRRKLGVAFSLIFFFQALPGAVFPFSVSLLVSAIMFDGIFALAVLLESANLIVLFTQLRETRPSHTPVAAEAPPSPISIRRVFSIPPGFLKIFTPFAMDAFSYGLAGAIIYGMWSDYFHFNEGDIGLIVGVLLFSVVATQYPATKFLLRFGTRTTLAFSEFLTVLVMAGWLLSSSPLVLAGLSAVFGLSVSAWVPANSALLMSAAPESQRGSISGKLAAVRGLVFVPAPIIGGLLFSAYGYYVPVFLGMVGESFTVVAILRLIPKS